MLLIGTAGYSYEDWRGPFYPENLDKKEMLPFYAKEFSFTEVNSSFYAMPNRFMLYHMREKTPDNFQFVMKAYHEMTHKREDNEQHFADFKESGLPAAGRRAGPRSKKRCRLSCGKSGSSGRRSSSAWEALPYMRFSTGMQKLRKFGGIGWRRTASALCRPIILPPFFATRTSGSC